MKLRDLFLNQFVLSEIKRQDTLRTWEATDYANLTNLETNTFFLKFTDSSDILKFCDAYQYALKENVKLCEKRQLKSFIDNKNFLRRIS